MAGVELTPRAPGVQRCQPAQNATTATGTVEKPNIGDPSEKRGLLSASSASRHVRYQIRSGSLAFNADRTFALTLTVRTTEYTADGSRIVGVGGDIPETEVGTYSIVGDYHANTVLVDLTFSAHRRFGSELIATILRSPEFQGFGGLHGSHREYQVRLQRPGDAEYVFGVRRQTDN